MTRLTMSDERSTRRLIDLPGDTTGNVERRPDSDRPTTRSAPSNEQVVNNKAGKTFSMKVDEAVRLQSPESFDVEEAPAEIDFNIDELEQELDVAIAAEFGDAPRKNPGTVDSGTVLETTPDMSNDRVDHAIDEVDEVAPTPLQDEPEQTGAQEPETSPLPTDDPGVSWPTRVMALSSGPFEALHPRVQRIVQLSAVSMAVWVPIVWLMVVTDGIGWLVP
jgi:hypothetical protein